MANHDKIKLILSNWMESLARTILFIIVSKVLNDPLSLTSPFPWIWLGPVLIALRYGLWPSQLSILLILLCYLYPDPTPIINMHFQLFTLGGFLLTLICVMFHSGWSKKIKNSTEVSDYLQKRIQTIAYAYKVGELAYQRLEQNYITKQVTIRSSLNELREMLAKSDGMGEETILNRLLNILALQCSLEVAAIFPVKNNQIMAKPITSIGKIKSPQKNDYLIRECIDNAAATYIRAEEMLKGRSSDFLVAVPFINQEDKIYALLIIETMPFLSLNNENIETINLLLRYFLEGKTVKNAELILKQYPDCPVFFANELQRLTNLYINTQQDSAVVVFLVLQCPHQEDYLFRLKQEKRGIDTSWESAKGENKFLFVLMPLSSHAGIESYRIRMNTVLESEFKATLNESEIKFKVCQISSINNPIHLIEDLMN